MHQRQKEYEFFSAYAYIERRSFRSRYASYLHEIKQKGYFEYGGCRFYADGIAAKGEKKINMRDRKTKVSFTWNAIKMYVQAESKGGMKEAILGVPNKEEIVANEKVDRQVVRAIFKELYGIDMLRLWLQD